MWIMKPKFLFQNFHFSIILGDTNCQICSCFLISENNVKSNDSHHQYSSTVSKQEWHFDRNRATIPCHHPICLDVGDVWKTNGQPACLRKKTELEINYLWYDLRKSTTYWQKTWIQEKWTIFNWIKSNKLSCRWIFLFNCILFHLKNTRRQTANYNTPFQLIVLTFWRRCHMK